MSVDFKQWTRRGLAMTLLNNSRQILHSDTNKPMYKGFYHNPSIFGSTWSSNSSQSNDLASEEDGHGVALFS